MSLSASFANSSGRCSPARRASWASALARVSMSTKSGSRCQKLRITATWPAPRSPLRCASAVAGSTGWQGFAVQSPPLAQVGGLVDAPRCFCAADPQPVGQRRGQLAAQLGRIGLLGELVDQRVFDGGLPAAHLLPPLQHPQPLGGGEHVERQVQGAFVAGFERVEDLDDLFPTTRTHVRILAKPADGNSPTNPRLWINVQLWIHRMLGCRPG